MLKSAVLLKFILLVVLQFDGVVGSVGPQVIFIDTVTLNQHDTKHLSKIDRPSH